MAKLTKPMTKAQLVTHMSEHAEVTKKQAQMILDELADQAAKQAKLGFTIPGIGKVTLAQRKARWGRNPQTGEKIKIKASKAVKIRVAKALKDKIIPPKKK